MTINPPASVAFLILADESAGWKIAGLRQLDRIILALVELAGDGKEIEARIQWRPDLPLSARWKPDSHPSVRINTAEGNDLNASGAMVISTHLLVARCGLTTLTESPPLSPGSWADVFQRLRQSRPSNGERASWLWVDTQNDIGRAERWFLRAGGKSQDGLVSRFLNRPISRTLSRFLLRYSVAPMAWTAGIFILPIMSFFLLIRGDYAGIVSATALFQLFSILDGCDGEIARAKYLESKKGARMDYLGDLAGNILFLVGLAIGLSRHFNPSSIASIYWWEGMTCAGIIVLHEIMLYFLKGDKAEAMSSLAPIMYSRHHSMIEHSGVGFLGKRFVWWLLQLTKRDVSVFVFLLLALVGVSQWILHLWLTVTVASLLLTLLGLFRRRQRAGSAFLV